MIECTRTAESGSYLDLYSNNIRKGKIMEENNIIDPTPAVGGTETSEEEELNAEVEVEATEDESATEAETETTEQPETDESESAS
jgi:hypothetical protein